MKSVYGGLVLPAIVSSSAYSITKYLIDVAHTNDDITLPNLSVTLLSGIHAGLWFGYIISALCDLNMQSHSDPTSLTVSTLIGVAAGMMDSSLYRPKSMEYLPYS